MKKKKKIAKTKDSSSKKQSIQKIGESGELVTQEGLNQLQELIKNPTTIGVLEFLTGIIGTAVDKPANLILSGGRLTQALFKGDLYKQLYTEIHRFRKVGKITDEQLESSQGKTLFVELMSIIDEENLDETKFNALKAVFLKSIGVDTDEQSQMLAYQYFQVCKKLSSLDILILKTAFEIYESNDRNQRSGGIADWEKRISEKLGVPVELVEQSRLRNSGISQTPNTIIFDAEKKANSHGLTGLGIKIGEFIKEQKD